MPATLIRSVLINATLTRRLGLGDAVAAVAKPVARAVDAVAGTDLQNCLGCGQRQADWNAAIPNLNPLAKGGPPPP